MHKLLTGFAVAAIALGAASAAHACDWHKNVSASAEPAKQVIAMSTPEKTISTTRAEAAAAKVAAQCPSGQADCAAGTK